MDGDGADRDIAFDRALSDLTWRMLALFGWQTALLMLLIGWLRLNLRSKGQG